MSALCFVAHRAHHAGMRCVPALAALVVLALPGPLPAADQDNVRIYRCTSSNGVVALQNAPCSDGRQQILDMQRPKDPPPRPANAASAKPAPPVPVREVRIVRVQPPQPMYECVSSEGERYTSETAEGNPRWVPTWVYGYPTGRPAHPSPTRPSGPGNRPPSGGVIVPYGSVQIRDECHALPQREVCARLADRRWELIQRYNSALQSERERLMREQRGIEARMDQDCGGV